MPSTRSVARRAAPLALLLVLLAGGPPGLAQAPASPEAGEAPAPWQVAPLWGGDVRSLAISPTDPDLLLAGTSSGQVYRSSDAGATWRPAGPFLPFPGWVVSALQFDPNRTDTPEGRLWAGLRGVWGSGHVAYSDDLGRTWISRATGLPEQPIYSLALVPGEEGRIYAGTLDGVWGTSDGGLSWAKLTSSLPELAKVTSLLVPPGRPETVIAGTWRRAYRSTDGGRTWQGVFDGMHLDSEVFTLVPTLRPGEVWASTCNWVYQSLDEGASWTRFVAGMDERRATAFDSLPWGRLLTGTVAGLYASDDEGRHWSRRTGEDLSVQVIAHHPGRGARVFLGTEGAGVWVSDDGAETFHPASVGLTNLRIAAVASAGDELFVAVNHAGPASGVYHSRDGGRTFPLHTGRSGSAEGSEGLPPVLSLAAARPAPAAGPASGPAPVLAWAATERGLYEWRGGSWRRVEALGTSRVDQVIARAGRVVARAGDGVWELSTGAEGAGGWQRTAYRHGAPRSATLDGGELWITDASGLYRVAGDSNNTVAAPYPAGRVVGLGDRLLYAGKQGAWVRAGLSAPWVPLAEGTTRALETGDPRYPALLLGEDLASLVAGDGGVPVPVELPVPAGAVEAALVDGGRLFLGTTGYGLLSTPLPAGPQRARAGEGDDAEPASRAAAGAAGEPGRAPSGPAGVNPP